MRRSAEQPLDVLIVGGGVVGCGALLDAAVRGLDAVLVEQSDIASGTSSRSSRLAHGGLRYLDRFGAAIRGESGRAGTGIVEWCVHRGRSR